jgi:signal transduction histidine kinase
VQQHQPQEDERKKISRELRDAIIQTLTGINIRLATNRKRWQTSCIHQLSVNAGGLRSAAASWSAAV